MDKKLSEEERLNSDPIYKAKVNAPEFAVMNDTDDSTLPIEQRRYVKGLETTKSTTIGIPPFDLLSGTGK